MKILKTIKKESENILEQAHTCEIDLVALLEKIERELESDKGNKELLKSKKVVKDRIKVREIITGVSQ